MKRIAFVGSALDELRDFTPSARGEAGHQPDRVQRGLDPEDWKPMTSIGAGVREIRVRDEAGAFRVLYVGPGGGHLRPAHLPEKDAKDGKPRLGSGDRQIAANPQGDEKMTKEPVQTFASVWDALEETPEESAHMRLRSELMMAVHGVVEGWKLTQAKSAKRLGVTQPRLNDLLRGRISRFSLDSLVGLAERAGLVVHMEITREAA
jgi:predicted XRE-type DNA-binding protein